MCAMITAQHYHKQVGAILYASCVVPEPNPMCQLFNIEMEWEKYVPTYNIGSLYWVV